MFGYLRVFKEELKMKDYELYRAYYCGLCKTMQQEYGFWSRFVLNYDSVFLAVLHSSLTGEKQVCLHKVCCAHPFCKRNIKVTDQNLSYCAAVMMTLALLKLKDDIRDDKSLKATLLYALLLPTKRRLLQKNSGMFLHASKVLDELTASEQANCTDTDKVAHTFATLLSDLFVSPAIKDESQKRVLANMGYLCGRFIYLLDAYEDFEEDKKKKRYNPYVLTGRLPDKDSFLSSMTYTLSALANSYRLLDPVCNKEIIDNILYLGLPGVLKNTVDTVLKGKLENERSL